MFVIVTFGYRYPYNLRNIVYDNIIIIGKALFCCRMDIYLVYALRYSCLSFIEIVG